MTRGIRVVTMLPDFLDQDEVWSNAEGMHRLDDMDPDHRANLIPFLRGNVLTLWRMEHGALAEPPTRAEAEEWLEVKPLMRRLCDLEAGRSIDDRRSTHERNRAYEQTTGYRKIRESV